MGVHISDRMGCVESGLSSATICEISKAAVEILYLLGETSVCDVLTIHSD